MFDPCKLKNESPFKQIVHNVKYCLICTVWLYVNNTLFCIDNKNLCTDFSDIYSICSMSVTHLQPIRLMDCAVILNVLQIDFVLYIYIFMV